MFSVVITQSPYSIALAKKRTENHQLVILGRYFCAVEINKKRWRGGKIYLPCNKPSSHERALQSKRSFVEGDNLLLTVFFNGVAEHNKGTT